VVTDPAKPEKPKKRKVFYYYALKFSYEFQEEGDTVYFSFAKPIPYTEILTDLHNAEKQLLPPPKKLQVAKKTSKMKQEEEKGKGKEEKKESIVNP
jgi:hypothetical protein